jgi:hypothetical protein
VRRIAVLVSLFIASAQVGAQIISVPKGSLAREPAFIFGVTVGLQSIQSINDGRTQTIWDFSQAAELGASLEKTLSRGVSFGVAATYSKMPLRYIDTTSIVGNVITCCTAHVDVITAGAQFTAGGGQGFHQLVVVNAGIIAFQHFDVKRNGSGSPSVPATRDIDPRLAIAYGFGYGFSARSEAFILQEYGVALHQGDGLQGSTRRQYQQQTTRVGYRVGIGGR